MVHRGEKYGGSRTARLGGASRSDTAGPHRVECILELPADGERGAQSGQLQDLMDLRVMAVVQHEREPE